MPGIFVDRSLAEKIKGYDPGGTASYTPAHSIRNFNVPLGSHPLMPKSYQILIGLSNLPKKRMTHEDFHENY
ncbi:MAG: hypothetical protein UU64_C0007G0042 [candidate division WWE3 bacterium GW2011_GWF2_41_45]|uniref:Uncharacterized protein n=1 Tax=candidate division WWE3 bacterium GW2011_GWC2_41_23 TaxID=1619123 RepID=A0A0G0VPL6_UNCKA|nr:MAG: hypothetical protein UU55_C0008G0010 [candidate division WWE3 bacterium GW2011_GWC2_41_23]KKS10229.1 MAG: hypothetical protein UU64_C0007G0042 [candidate division WWE3 bacterium GW2011_GWF2_41_45]KKS19971.1 MAG: hypothetical protein UU79_C0006G0010 [candidate division WWE3 bacterium GW2011_GWE1_41_72]KKS28208.1 MAG: hypothetical protein UU86_C0008G0007 [candidate division WWE3 bacterium GW2011_GWC1_42_102]KKS29127.1 MAG: hypothetical protein UU90_C0012G0010 [candidate division WWE3 bact